MIVTSWVAIEVSKTVLGAKVRVEISVIGDVTVWNSVVLYVDGAKVLVMVLRDD